MFTHHVFFWLKDPGNKKNYSDLLEGIKSLQQITPMVSSHVGVPATTNRPVIDTSYTFSLLIIFNNLQDQESYQTHPIHLKFVENCASLWSKVVIYDSIDPQN